MTPDEIIGHIIATHEAGHAVAAWHLGEDIVSLSVRELGGRLESTKSTDEAYASVCLAGPLAQRRHRNCGRVFGCAGDLKRFKALTRPGYHRRRIFRITARILDELWPHVEMLAAELQKRKTMTGAEVSALIERMPPK